MYKQLIENKLKTMGIPYRIRGIEIQCACLNPEHKDSHPSFSINSKTSQFYCFSCQFKGSFKRYLDGEIDEDMERKSVYIDALRSLEDSESISEITQEIILPPKSELEIPDEGLRGVSKEFLNTLGIYYCTVGRFKQRWVFPIFNTDEEVIGFDTWASQHPKGTQEAPNSPKAKYLRSTSFSTKEHYYGINKVTEDYVMVTEGIWDCITLMFLGYPAICNFGLSTPSITKVGDLLAKGVSEVMNALDFDEPAYKAWREELRPAYNEYFTIAKPNSILKDIHKAKCKDANEYLLKQKEEL